MSKRWTIEEKILIEEAAERSLEGESVLRQVFDLRSRELHHRKTKTIWRKILEARNKMKKLKRKEKK